MRRIIGGSAALVVAAGTVFVLPVYAAPLPQAEAVPPSIAHVEMGSVLDPAADAVVATDDRVVDAGVDSGVDVGAVVTPDAGGSATEAPATEAPATDAPATDAPATDAPAADGVATTGEEVGGVPALSVNQPDTAGFSAVGVTWAHDAAATGVTVSVRVQAVDGTWGEWTSLEPDDVEQAPPPGSTGDRRDGTAPYFTGPASGVQVVVQAADGSVPRDVRTELIDPGTSAADTALGSPQVQDSAHAGMTMPTIYSRAQWGADESIRTWDPEYSSTVKAATVHHTADSNDYTPDQVPSILRSIYAYHTISRGWGDIGYNVLVDKYGRAWEGRYSGSRGISSPVIGAHAGGFNSYTFGVSMIGNYDTAPTTPAMISTVAAVIAWKLSLYGVDPAGTTQLTSSGGGTSRYAAGTTVTLPTVFGHRDVGATSCPGQYGYAQLDEVRAQARNLWITAREPSGSLDGAVGGERRITVAGWALDPDQPTNALAVHVYVDGRPEVALTADRPRPDVAAANPGTGTAHGYQVTVAATAGTHSVCTYAINVGAGTGNPQLGCRTVTVTGPSPEPRGAVDAAAVLGRTAFVGGWAFDDDAPTEAVQVHVYVDGVGAAVLDAGGTRDDIAAAFPGVGAAHGFSGQVRLGDGVHRVCIYAIGIGPGGNTELGCRVMAVGPRPDDPVLSVDVAAVTSRTLTVAGWAIDPDAPRTPVGVHVYVDGVGRVVLLADAARPDLAGVWPGAGVAHGWSTSLVLRAGPHQVCVYAINAGPGATTAAGCRTVTVADSAYDPVGALDAAAVSGRTATVRGWAMDPDVPSAATTVHLYLDGAPVTAVLADGSRPDVASVLPGAGAAHGWTATTTVPAGQHRLCAFAINTGSGSGNPLLGCMSVTVAAAAWNPVGAVDSVSRSGDVVTVSGWAADPDAPTGAQQVHVYVDGRSAAAMTTGSTRPDVASALGWAGPATGYRGAVAVTTGSHQICVYAINTGDGSTNPLLGCRTVAP